MNTFDLTTYRAQLAEEFPATMALAAGYHAKTLVAALGRALGLEAKVEAAGGTTPLTVVSASYALSDALTSLAFVSQYMVDGDFPTLDRFSQTDTTDALRVALGMVYGPVKPLAVAHILATIQAQAARYGYTLEGLAAVSR